MTTMMLKVLEKLKKIESKPFLDIGNLRRLYKEDKVHALYVLNNADMDGRRDQGEICLSISTSTNQLVPVTIPITFAPVELSSKAPIEQIINSMEFANMVNANKILVFKPGIAEELMETHSEVKEEALRVANGDRATETSFNDEKAGVIINPAMMVVLEDNAINDRDRVSKLLNMQGKLTRDDYEYILASQTSDTMKRFATDSLKELEGAAA